MYEIMIVDDEKFVRDHIKEAIDWNRFDLHLACEAEDSNTARELYYLFQPNIIFMDVRIPGISGIELSKELSQNDPDLQIIIVTSFAEFEYAKAALSAGVADFLTKPIDKEEINASIQKAIDAFEYKKSKYLSGEAMKEIIKSNMIMLRERRVSQLLKSISPFTDEQIHEQMEILSLNFRGKYYAAVSSVFDARDCDEADFEVFLASAKNIMDTRLSDKGFKSYSFFNNTNRMYTLVSWEQDDGAELLESTINEFYKKMLFYFQYTVFVGIGEPVEQIAQVHTSLLQAEASIKYQNIMESSVISYKNLKKIGKLDVIVTIERTEFINLLIDRIRAQDFPGVKSRLDTWLEIQRISEIKLEDLQKFAVEFIFKLTLMHSIIDSSAWNRISYVDAMVQISTASNLGAIKDLLLKMAEKACRIMAAKKNAGIEQKSRIIVMAKEYITTHLADTKLTLEEVSSYVELSKDYFGKIFHKEEGVCFNNYLNQQRVDYAKKLLIDTNNRIIDISVSSGFWSPRYFGVVFKSLTGMSPQEYRQFTNNSKNQ